MNRTLIIGSLITALAAAAASSAGTECSIHPQKGATNAQLTGLAKVSRADAEKTALAGVKSPATVAEAELESEHGCLVWSLDLKVTGKTGVQEVQVDAGTGKMLSQKHESAAQESTEAAQEAAEPKQP